MKKLKTDIIKFNEDYSIIKIYTKDTIDFYLQKSNYGHLYFICGVYEDIELIRDYVYQSIGIAELSDFWGCENDFE